jgi:predicted nuclease of predicted toxin-antitoxin system
MRIKLDENLPVVLVDDLAALGHDVDTALSEGLGGHEDADVWAGAQAAGRMLLTQDLDFSDVRVFAPGTHPGLVIVRVREPGLLALQRRLVTVLQAEQVEHWAGCFVVITDRKLRVRRPKQN